MPQGNARNPFSTYGRLAMPILPIGDGKCFIVTPSTSTQMPNFQQMFPLDEDGVVRVTSTVASAISQTEAGRGDVIYIFGSIDEAVTVPRTTSNLTIIGGNTKQSSAIAPSTASAVALTVDADDVTLINLDIASGTSAANAFRGTGSRIRAIGCKFEGADTSGNAFGYGPGSVAQVNAGTAGHGGDLQLIDCEFAWTFNGISFIASDYGAATQLLIKNALFHNNSNTCLIGTPGAFGIGSVRNLNVVDSVFDNMEDGTAPSDFVNVNTAFDTGTFSGNRFALATNASADLKIGAGILWMANATEAGWSTARPS